VFLIHNGHNRSIYFNGLGVLRPSELRSTLGDVQRKIAYPPCQRNPDQHVGRGLDAE
jgi:hypothetical protein